MKYSHLAKYLFMGLFLSNATQAGSNNDLITIDANGRPSPALHVISTCINDHTQRLDAKTRYTIQRAIYAGFQKLRQQRVTKTYHLSNVMMIGYNELKKNHSKNIITINNWGTFNRRISTALQCGASHPTTITPGSPPIIVIQPPIKGGGGGNAGGSGSHNPVKPSKPAPSKPKPIINKPPPTAQNPGKDTRPPMVYEKFGGGVVTFNCKGRSSPSVNSIQHCVEQQLKHDTSKANRDVLRQTIAKGLKQMGQGHVVRVTSIKDVLNRAANKTNNLQLKSLIK